MIATVVVTLVMLGSRGELPREEKFEGVLLAQQWSDETPAPRPVEKPVDLNRLKTRRTLVVLVPAIFTISGAAATGLSVLAVFGFMSAAGSSLSGIAASFGAIFMVLVGGVCGVLTIIAGIFLIVGLAQQPALDAEIKAIEEDGKRLDASRGPRPGLLVARF